MIADDELLGGRLVAIGRPLPIPCWAENDLRLDTWDRHVLAALDERGRPVAIMVPSEILDRVRGKTLPAEIDRVHESIGKLRRLGIVTPTTGGGWLVRPVLGLPARSVLSFFDECLVLADGMPADEREIFLATMARVRDDEREGGR